MAVTVRIAGAPARIGDKTHDEADDLIVDDTGCLIITAGSGRDEKTIAAYAAGVWISAEVR
jgi:hypothetical protein